MRICFEFVLSTEKIYLYKMIKYYQLKLILSIYEQYIINFR